MEDPEEKKLQAKWEGMSDAKLVNEVTFYRKRIREACDDITSRGGKVPKEDRPENLDGDAGGASAAAGEEEGGTSAGGDGEGDEVTVQLQEGSVDDLDPSEWHIPPHAIPIHANVTTYNFKPLSQKVQFDVIMMDPPWQLATANPTRGVALGYSQLTDNHITKLPVPQLQTNGYLFIWVINAKYKYTLDLFQKWGYELVDEIVWVKMTVNRRLAKSHGYYLQHAKEVCLVGRKGKDPAGAKSSVASDIIFSERRGQSQKPEEIYEIIEELVPNGKYLEIFARKNNLRNYWVSLGNEVTGTGLPESDLAAVEATGNVPSAVNRVNRVS
mmetsp:Transcript_47476/g.152101  ORF Transcript_47476/g.152101 Transcript_47476/m.152101 type:complete len:327 (+) Transcript_47476:83-1063(+)